MQGETLDSKEYHSTQPFVLRGYWEFDKFVDNIVVDLSEHGNNLIGAGKPLLHEDKYKGIMLDGAAQWLGTSKSVIKTNRSFSVVAWVLIDGIKMNNKLELKKDVHALTAVSQDSSAHSAFHLGIRQIKNVAVRGSTTSLSWCFTVSPHIDSLNSECQDAYATSLLDISILNKWFMLVGVYDVIKRSATIYVPNMNDIGEVYMPDTWTFWHADGGLQIGRSLWEKQNVDLWPGCIGSVRVYSGVLQQEDVKQLYLQDKVNYR